MKSKLIRLLTMIFMILLCVSLASCGVIDGGKAFIHEKTEELLHGSEADQKLMNALLDGNFEAMCEALDADADMDTLRHPLYSNPLLYLLASGDSCFISTDSFGNLLDLNFAEELLKRGADPNWANNHGQTLLMFCCGCDGYGYPGATPLLNLLISYGADVNAKDKDGYTALDYASDTGQAKILLEHGAVVSEETLTRSFSTAQDFPNIFIRKLLLDAYLRQGGTPRLPEIMLAAMQGDSAEVIAQFKTGAVPSEYQTLLSGAVVAFCNADAVRAAQECGFCNGGESDRLLYLELAILADQTEIAEMFASPDKLFEALKLAITYNQPNMARQFLELGALNGYATVDFQESFPWEVFDNLLSDAAKTGNVELVKLLLEYGYPTNELSLWQTVNDAICANSLETVRYLCEECGASTTYVYEDNYTPLEMAAMRGTVEIAKYLVSRGVRVEDTPTCLYNAVLKGHTEMAEYLLSQDVHPSGAAVRTDGTVSEDALSEAVRRGRLDLVKLLVEAGADVNGSERWDSGFTPVLCSAARKPSEHIVAYLIEHGADVNIVDSDGDSPLELASSKEIAAIIQE